MGASPRLTGVSSRFARADGPRHLWTTGQVTVDLPVIVDWVRTDPVTGDAVVSVEARVDLIDGEPQVVLSLVAPAGLDLAVLQREFRWASPLTAVTGILPRLVAAGSDPFAVDLPSRLPPSPSNPCCAAGFSPTNS